MMCTRLILRGLDVMGEEDDFLQLYLLLYVLYVYPLPDFSNILMIILDQWLMSKLDLRYYIAKLR